MMPNLNIGGFTVQTYGLLLIIAVWAGLSLAAREARRLEIDDNQVNNLGFYALLATILGARLVYVTSHWSAYQGALLSALSPTPTALAWPEGALIGSLAAVIYWSRSRLPVEVTLDAIAPGLALALAIVRVGAFLDGSALGEPTTLPWGVYLWGEVRHPVQLYQATALLVILVLLLRRKGRGAAGETFVLFVAMYAGSRLFLDAFRTDAPLLAGGIRTIQVVALAAMLAAIWRLYRLRFSSAE